MSSCLGEAFSARSAESAPSRRRTGRTTDDELRGGFVRLGRISRRLSQGCARRAAAEPIRGHLDPNPGARGGNEQGRPVGEGPGDRLAGPPGVVHDPSSRRGDRPGCWRTPRRVPGEGPRFRAYGCGRPRRLAETGGEGPHGGSPLYGDEGRRVPPVGASSYRQAQTPPAGPPHRRDALGDPGGLSPPPLTIPPPHRRSLLAR